MSRPMIKCVAPKFPDDHVLDSLAWPSHFHGVRKVRPPERITGPLMIEWLLLHDFIGLDACFAVDISWLRWANGRVHEDDGILHVLFRIEQQFEVLLVNGVAVLESDH